MRHRHHYPTLDTAILLTLILGCTAVAHAAKPGGGKNESGPEYEIFRLSQVADNSLYVNAQARDINDSSLIVGQVNDPVTDDYLPACWTVDDSGASALLILPSELEAVAVALNDNDEIVGSGQTANGAWVAQYWLNPLALPLSLPPLPGDSESDAFGLNNDGVVCGISYQQLYDELGEPTHRAQTAVAWRVVSDPDSGVPVVSGPIALPSDGESFARAINDSDANGLAEIVGDFANYTAGVWTVHSDGEGTLSANPNPEILAADAEAYSINEDGAVCGWHGDAIVWGGSASTTLDRDRYTVGATPFDINDLSVVVGRARYESRRRQGLRAVVWESVDAPILFLDNFLGKNSSFLSLQSAYAVNNSGRIVGLGWDGEFWGAFLAVPK